MITYKKYSKGFTLVELSIVIIGFIIAGISAGSSLIAQVKLRYIISEIRNYQTSYNSFKIQYYNNVPGDIPIATLF